MKQIQLVKTTALKTRTINIYSLKVIQLLYYLIIGLKSNKFS